MTTEKIEVQIMHEGTVYLVNKNNKVQNTETNGYIRKAETVAIIVEKAEKIRQVRIEADAKKQARIEEIKADRESMKQERLEAKKVQSEKPVIVKEVHTMNDSLRGQLAYEFLVLGNSIKELEKLSPMASNVLFNELQLNESHKGNFMHCKYNTILKTLKRYGKDTIANLLHSKFYSKKSSDKYGMKIS